MPSGANQHESQLRGPDAIQVAAGVLWRGDRVLVCRRRDTDSHPGRWEFPGGKVEPGESPAECLRREIAEELGVHCAVGNLIARHRHEYRGGPTVDLWFYEVTEFQGEPQNRIFAAIDWLRPDELDSIELLDADLPLVATLRRISAPLAMAARDSASQSPTNRTR